VYEAKYNVMRTMKYKKGNNADIGKPERSKQTNERN